jgi:predicted ferric reductase
MRNHIKTGAWPFAILLFSRSIAAASGQSECGSDVGCGVLGNAMLQLSATHGGAKEHMELRSTKIGKASLTGTVKASLFQNPTGPVFANPTGKNQSEAEKDADEPELAPSWFYNAMLFTGFSFTIFLTMIIVLAFLQMVVHCAQGQKTRHLATLDAQADQKPKLAKAVDRATESVTSCKTKLKRNATTVNEVAKDIVGWKFWKRINGDHVRLGILHDIANSKDIDAKVKELIAKACKAHKLKLSSEAISQSCTGLMVLAKAVQGIQKNSKFTGSPKQKFKQAVKQVMTMTRVSRIFSGLLNQGNASEATSEWGGIDSHLERKHTDGHAPAVHGSFQDTRLANKSSLASYLASQRLLDHMAILFVFGYSQLCALVYAMYLKHRFPKMYLFMGPWLLVSRGEAMAVIVLTVLMIALLSRGIITKLRRFMSWSVVLQTIADKHVLIHKYIGIMLVVCAVLHVVGHARGSIPAIIGETDRAVINEAFTYGTKIRFNFNTWGEALKSWPAVTGILLVLILCAFWGLSNERARKYSFELFHYPHLILIVLWCVTLIAHGWKQWLGIGVPIASVSVAPMVVLYIIDRIMAIRSGSHASIRISNAIVKKSNVLLEIDTGSTGFSYNTGMYVMVKVPEISDFQWHPFTIASGGGQSKLQILFATVGDWTRELQRLLLEAQKKEGAQGVPYPTICVRGGYGAPAQGMKDKEHIIMVGAGVGATPFLSFLSNVCSLEPGTYDQFKGVKSAVFYWLSREPADFIWVNEYSQHIASSELLKDRIQVRLVLTKSLDADSEAKEKGEIALFWLALEVALNKFESPELASELGVPTQFGRPKWGKEFTSYAKELTEKLGENVEEVAVFACGNMMLVQSLEEACVEVSTESETKFRLFAEEF